MSLNADVNSKRNVTAGPTGEDRRNVLSHSHGSIHLQAQMAHIKTWWIASASSLGTLDRSHVAERRASTSINAPPQTDETGGVPPSKWLCHQNSSLKRVNGVRFHVWEIPVLLGRRQRGVIPSKNT